MPPSGTGGFVPVVKTGRKESLADTVFLGVDAAGLAKGDELAKKAGAGMSKAFKDAATSNQNQAVLFIPQLQGVDLSNEQAVEAAFAAAAKAKANPTNINAARNAVNEYRLNQSKLSGASK